jgi:hypothetical protein
MLMKELNWELRKVKRANDVSRPCKSLSKPKRQMDDEVALWPNAEVCAEVCSQGSLAREDVPLEESVCNMLKCLSAARVMDQIDLVVINALSAWDTWVTLLCISFRRQI